MVTPLSPTWPSHYCCAMPRHSGCSSLLSYGTNKDSVELPQSVPHGKILEKSRRKPDFGSANVTVHDLIVGYICTNVNQHGAGRNKVCKIGYALLRILWGVRTKKSRKARKLHLNPETGVQEQLNSEMTACACRGQSDGCVVPKYQTLPPGLSPSPRHRNKP